MGQQGVTVIVSARAEREAAEAADKLRSEGIEAEPIALDVTNAADRTTAAKFIESHYMERSRAPKRLLYRQQRAERATPVYPRLLAAASRFHAWKSNPYRTSQFTSESDSLHPQWVVMDLGAEKPVTAVRIAWASPYAKTYRVDYLVGRDSMGRSPDGQWKTFPNGAIENAEGGNVTLKLAGEPVSTRYLRIWMTESSTPATCMDRKISATASATPFSRSRFRMFPRNPATPPT